MKCVDLMTFFCSQAYPVEESYITVRNVNREKGKKKSLELDEVWKEILSSEHEVQGKCVGQHFCLLSEEANEQRRKQFWEKQINKMVMVSFVKVIAERYSEISEVQKDLENVVKSKRMSDVKVFKTIDNMDFIVFAFGDEELFEDIANRMKNKLNGRCNIFCSFSGKVIRTEAFMITDIKMIEKSVPKMEKSESDWCLKQITTLRQKILDNKDIDNRKWASYYQKIVHMLNLLSIYESDSRYEDLYHIYYPPIKLFLEQLKKSEKKQEESHEKIMLQKKTEQAISEFIDSMEILIYHLGMREENILGIGGGNGLPYDIPIKLCMYYLATLHLSEKVLNDENYEYRFCLSPVACSVPKTNIFDFGLEPTDRLIRVSVTRCNLYNIRSLQAILCHEVSHYVGTYRQRKERAAYFITACAIILVELLLPNSALDRVMDDHHLEGKEKEAFRNNWHDRKDDILNYCTNKIVAHTKNQNIQIDAKEKYHFTELEMQVVEAVAELLYDREHLLLFYINKVSDDLKKHFMQFSEESKLLDAYEDVQREFQDNLGKLAVGCEIEQKIGAIKYAFKEIYADISSIILLNVPFEDYLYNYIVSEGNVPQEESISNLLINRVAIVQYTMRRVEVWNENAEIVYGNSEEVSYQEKLKECVKRYMENYVRQEELEKIEKVSCEEESHQEVVDQFLIKEIIDQEIYYSVQCAELLMERMKNEENRKALELLRRSYKSGSWKEENFDGFLEAYDKLIWFFKTDEILDIDDGK